MRNSLLISLIFMISLVGCQEEYEDITLIQDGVETHISRVNIDGKVITINTSGEDEIEIEFACPNGDTFVTTDVNHIFNEEEDCPRLIVSVKEVVNCKEGFYESIEECPPNANEWFSTKLKDGIHCCEVNPEVVECPDGFYESFEECEYGEWHSSRLKEGIHCCEEKPDCPDGLKECDECGEGRVSMGTISCCEVCAD